MTPRKPTKFSDLKSGDRFIFNDIRAARPVFNETYGPFVKISRRKYRMTDGNVMPTDSVGFIVIKIEG